MAETNLKIVIDAVNNAEKAFENISADLKKIQKDMEPAISASKKFAIGIAGAATAASVFGVVAVKSAMDAELAQKQLEHAVIGVSKGTKEQLTQMNALIDATEKKGVVDGDALKTGVAQLSTFGLSTEMVKNLIPALADLTVNQSGLNASSEDFVTSANTIAKALNGQFGILEKSGIRFTEAQQKMIQFGTENERTAALIEGFNQNLKLTNETARQTSAGEIQALKIQFGNISEEIGLKLLPIINDLLGRLNVFVSDTLPKVIEKINEATNWLKEHKEIVIIVAGAIIGAMIPAFISMAITLVTVTIPAFVAAAVALAPFMLAGAVIAGVVLGILWLIKNWELVSAKAREIWEKIKGYLAGVLDWIKTKFQNIADALKNAWNAAWDAIAGKVNAVWEGIKNTVKSGVNWVIEKINNMIRAANSVSSKIPGIGAALSIPEIPLLASGGIVTRPTMAVIGESGPEAVVPLSRGFAGAGVGGITININGGIFSSRDAALEIGNTIAEIVKEQLKI